MEGKWIERGKMDSEGYTGLMSDTPTDFCLLSLLPGVDGSLAAGLKTIWVICCMGCKTTSHLWA